MTAEKAIRLCKCGKQRTLPTFAQPLRLRNTSNAKPKTNVYTKYWTLLQAATHIVKLMDGLFAIDAEAREQNMDHATRHALRLKKMPALLDHIRAQILAAQKDSLPKSATGKAANYALALWNKLTQFLQYPELELSNNLAENSMRPIAIGRKNWIHISSAQAGPKIAATSRWWRAAAESRSRYAITSPQCCQDSTTSPSGTWPTSHPQPGPQHRICLPHSPTPTVNRVFARTSPLDQLSNRPKIGLINHLLLLGLFKT
jgi:hypothetical protein